MLKLAKWSSAVSISAMAVALVAFRSNMQRAYRRVCLRGTVIPSPYGNIEYTEAGAGPGVLVSHGSGGGYDQGELIAQAVLGDGFQVITPSRFGYLRSTLPAGATWADQAHAYAHLLDHLGLDKVAVVAMSQGGPPALLFAVLHPERVSSLTLISCGAAPSTADEQAAANTRGRMLKMIFKHDFLYWSIATLFKRQLLGLVGASKDVVARLTPGQRRITERFIDWMNPASLRSAGAAFDNEAALPGPRIAAIQAPTLIFHARDDTLQLYHNAVFAASTIPDARLICFERGGHLVIGVEQPAIRASLRDHILGHLAEAPAQSE